MTFDVELTDCGSFLRFSPLTPEGECWFDDYLEGATTWDGDAILAEYRFGYDIIGGLLDSGLTISKGGGQIVRAQ